MSMSNQIQFEGENGQGTFRSRDIFGAPTTPKMISFMIKKGIAKDEKTAGNMLIGMAVSFVVLAVIIMTVFVWGYNPSEQKMSKEDYIRSIEAMNSNI